MSRLMVVVAHPDDEVIHCGGALRRAANAAWRTSTVTLTPGQAGRTLDICSVVDLPRVRERELQAAGAILGVGRIEALEFADGVVAGAAERAARRVAGFIERDRPRVLVTFPPNGMNGHPDHVATHHVVRAALAIAGHRPARLYYFADAADFTEPARPGYLPPEEVNRLRLPVTCVVDVRDVLAVKLAAMGQHETQARSIVKQLRLYPSRILVEPFHHAAAGR